MRFSGFKVLLMLTCALSSRAFAVECPSHDFAGFVKVFSANPPIQQAFTASPVLKFSVVPDNDLPRIARQELQTLEPGELRMLGADVLAKSGLTVQVKLPDRAIVRDQAGKVLSVLAFERKECWVLKHVEDWSLEALLDAQARTTAFAAGERAMRRGAIFNNLGFQARQDEADYSYSEVQLFEAALDSYLDGAQQGSPDAAYAAVGISLSGQAQRLDNAKIIELLSAALKGIPEAGVALAAFYCDQGEYGETRACVEPHKSLAVLQDSARSGYAGAFDALGSAYETGNLGTKNLPRAMACYLQARKISGEAGTHTVNRLAALGVAADERMGCL